MRNLFVAFDIVVYIHTYKHPSLPTARVGLAKCIYIYVYTEKKREQSFTNRGLKNGSIVIAIVSWLDLNTLDNLSRTCRQIRENLLQYRGPLVTHTMHCYKEQPPLEPEDNEMNWYYMTINESYRRKGSCARDMVSECRRCARPVCRVSDFT